jgi:hypothetical protein
MEDSADLLTLSDQLKHLTAEHRDLDQAIADLQRAPLANELLIRRLKKRKLLLKDRISWLHRQLDPDVPA